MYITRIYDETVWWQADTDVPGFIIIGDFEGYIHIIDPVNGKTIGRKKISKNPIKTLISRSKNFYAVDESFNLYALNI